MYTHTLLITKCSLIRPDCLAGNISRTDNWKYQNIKISVTWWWNGVSGMMNLSPSTSTKLYAEIRGRQNLVLRGNSILYILELSFPGGDLVKDERNRD